MYYLHSTGVECWYAHASKCNSFSFSRMKPMCYLPWPHHWSSIPASAAFGKGSPVTPVICGVLGLFRSLLRCCSLTTRMLGYIVHLPLPLCGIHVAPNQWFLHAYMQHTLPAGKTHHRCPSCRFLTRGKRGNSEETDIYR